MWWGRRRWRGRREQSLPLHVAQEDASDRSHHEGTLRSAPLRDGEDDNARSTRTAREGIVVERVRTTPAQDGHMATRVPLVAQITRACSLLACIYSIESLV